MMQMKKLFTAVSILACSLLGFMSCSEDDNTYDAYANWPARNAEYFAQKAAEAQLAIAQAKAQYGDDWQEHCDWRMFRSTSKTPGMLSSLTDSICVHIQARGEGEVSPIWSDTVRVNYRGYLIPTQNVVNGELVDEQKVFSQSYLGELNPQIAVPAVMSVSEAVAGFATALQHMHKNDIWTVYIPSDLAYAGSTSGAVLPYSTLTFNIHLVEMYKAGTVVPDWK